MARMPLTGGSGKDIFNRAELEGVRINMHAHTRTRRAGARTTCACCLFAIAVVAAFELLRVHGNWCPTCCLFKIVAPGAPRQER